MRTNRLSRHCSGILDKDRNRIKENKIIYTNSDIMPKVSVLIPIYNTPIEVLSEAIKSILNQTYNDFELIILNDSPANKELRNFVLSFKDSRIVYAENAKNMGISYSRNKLIDLSRGEYLATMDHDDVSLPQRLEKQVAFLDAHPDVGLLATWSRNIGGLRVKRQPVEDMSIKEVLMLHCCIEHSSTMLRKSILIDNNIRYRGEYSPAEDYALFCDLIGVAKFHNLPEVLLLYRDSTGNTSNNNRSKMRNSTIALKAEFRRKYPALWEVSREKYLNIIDFRLFGIIPLFRIVKRDEYRYNLYLFGFILLIKCKIKVGKK